jgi:hypothetical protein
MPIGGIVVPRSFSRTPTQRFADAVYQLRSSTDPEDREICLPVIVPPGHRLPGCPASGAFRLTPEPKER